GHPTGPPPLIFLNKSQKVVQFQLNRLAASQLLQIPRSTKHTKFKPVYTAILLRPGLSRQDREESVQALVALNGTNPVSELLDGISRLDGAKRTQQDVIRQLATILLKRSGKTLAAHRGRFRKEAMTGSASVRPVALAGLISSDDADAAWKIAAQSARAREDFLTAVRLIPRRADRAVLRGRVVSSLSKTQPLPVRRAAVETLGFVPSKQKENFNLVAPLVRSRRLRNAAVRTLSRIPKKFRSLKSARQIVGTLVVHAERTPAARRTTPRFLDAMHLADELLALLPVAESRRFRARLRAVVVRVVRINTVHEEMRYDTPYFAVEAGRPVQLVLRNEDLMPHNLVITRPGKLKDVAFAAAAMPPRIDRSGRLYVPKTGDVLFATKLVPSHSQAVLTFTAPKKPGVYPYVCTFPNHWMRMYGVMVVVKDLAEWSAAPIAPKDPLGYNRKIVQRWTMDDFQGDLSAALSQRQPKNGMRIFQEATCALCHKLGNQGRPVGPDLSESFKRHKNDDRAVLQSILDPSHKVDPKYALYNVVTVDGKVISGVITRQSRESITIVSNPEHPKPQTIARDDIDEMKKSSVSMMPRGILDRYTREEILDLLAYLKSANAKKPKISGSQ
ncbi:MAG: c-type cytochrome, partial [Planctomycetes bacterium]|nr:c-type cytochrome [Planctomycetota bacterium]